jgi:YbbR domain-containing protein
MAKKNKQQIMLSIFSLFIAFILWLYVMGDKNPIQIRVIENVPVSLVNTENITQANLVLVPNQTFTVNLTVTGRALDVFNAVPSDFKVEADMSGYLKKGDNNIPVEIKETPKGVSVVNKNGYPYIRVKLDSLIDKSVPVTVNVAGKVKEGFQHIPPILRPTEVIVSGPASYVNSVSSVVGQIDITGNYTTVNGSIPVKPVDKDGKVVPYVEVDPKYIDVSISIKPSKEVPIVVKTTGEITGNKAIKSIIPKVTKVVIIGDKEVIDKIRSIETVPYNISNLRYSVTKELLLDIPSNVTILDNIRSVNVDFVVEDIVERTFSVPITLINENTEYSYTLSDTNVSITVSGAESVLNSIGNSDFTAVVDVKDLAEGDHVALVKTTIPEIVKLKDTSPQKVAIKIAKKQ